LKSSLLCVGLLSVVPVMCAQSANDWPTYNRTLMGDRFAPQTQITPATAAKLHEVCRYDMKQQTSFQTGPLVIGGVMYLTTGHDTVAIDAATCAEKWRVHEDYTPAVPNDTNRGAAVMDGRIFRGTQDGRVLAYDLATGKKIWEATLGVKDHGESIPTAPLAWNGLVFAGNAGGEKMPVKGRMYAMDAATGKIVWEQYMAPRGPEDKANGPAAPAPKLVSKEAAEGGTSWTAYSLDPATGTLYVPGGNPTNDKDASYTVALDAKTGAVKAVYGAVLHDFHDWEVSAPASLFTTTGGKHLLVQATKDGFAYAVALPAGREVWKSPVTTITDATAPMKAGGVHFCPGGQGGNEWNGAAYSKATNMVYVGAVDWCATAMPPVGNAESKRVTDAADTGTGWVTALNAETGKMAWHFHTPMPVLGGVTPTAGGVVFAGDLAGTVYAFDAKTGDVAWKSNVGGAVGGGIISYSVGDKQRIAVAAGMKSVVWPMAKGSAVLVVYGLE
jgi:alcohol dehydrogenase (cytochrome c)